MPSLDQGYTQDRYQVIPRVLIFVYNENRVLLIKGARNKRIWVNKYNGVGGHVEVGENILEAAYRELREESGMQNVDLHLCGNIVVNLSNASGILLFIFRGEYRGEEISSSSEGNLEWVDCNQIHSISTVEDLPMILARVKGWKAGDEHFFGLTKYDVDDRLVIKFQN